MARVDVLPVDLAPAREGRNEASDVDGREKSATMIVRHAATSPEAVHGLARYGSVKVTAPSSAHPVGWTDVTTFDLAHETVVYPVTEVRKVDDPSRTETVDAHARKGLVFKVHLDGFHGQRVLRYEADFVEQDELEADLDTGRAVRAPRRTTSVVGGTTPFDESHVSGVVFRDPTDDAANRYVVVVLEGDPEAPTTAK